ncbi:MAG: 16S rRNA (cytidine(1402)-2'-O)-methyltransferase [Lachnospiraceae bacterium]|nr:16S rRNA (cytidine(1402)-2'-O)-methyltransferase [Lachnospiraceae bacterium]
MDERQKCGMLYLCATPIGNLSDISERVIETLKGADLIAAEDTRNSMKLLNRFDIRVPLTSYHEYNKYDKAAELIEKMKAGMNVALVTDAGTPGISDPGEVITDMCHKEGIAVTSLPGPCAAVTALSVSGMSTGRFVFEGFLPSGKKERQQILSDLSDETRTIIIYEAPHHLKKTLETLLDALGDRDMAVCRELTKKHEEVRRMRLSEASAYYGANEPRGEYVLVIEGRSPEEIKEEIAKTFLSTDIREHVAAYEEKGFDRKEAMKKVAADRGITKREVYSKMLEETDPKEDKESR